MIHIRNVTDGALLLLCAVTKDVAGALGSLAGGEVFTLLLLVWLAFQRSEILRTTRNTGLPYDTIRTSEYIRSLYRRDHGMYPLTHGLRYDRASIHTCLSRGRKYFKGLSARDRSLAANQGYTSAEECDTNT